jgi:hypothetical protein
MGTICTNKQRMNATAWLVIHIWIKRVVLEGKDGTYVGDPSKDVGVEADMVLADIKSTLYQDFFLKSTTVIYFRFFSPKEQEWLLLVTYKQSQRNGYDGYAEQDGKVQKA